MKKETPATVLAPAMQRLIRIWLLTTAAICAIFILTFRIELNASDYDLRLSPHFLPGISFGFNLDGVFEIWKVETKADNSREIVRLFP